jgi:uncharacterized membrane protein
MDNAEFAGSAEAVGLPAEEKKLATIVYVLQAVGFFSVITALIGVIINHIKKGEMTNEIIKSHFSWQLRTFWWGLLWSALAIIAATFTLGIGGFLFIPVFVWLVYRVVKGWMRLNDGKSV